MLNVSSTPIVQLGRLAKLPKFRLFADALRIRRAQHCLRQPQPL
jgi:hypothetical protein